MSFSCRDLLPSDVCYFLPFSSTQPIFFSALCIFSILSIVCYLLLPTKDELPSWFPFYGSIKSVFWLADLIEEGYRKLHGLPFRFPKFGLWRVIISDPSQIEEIRKAPENILSFQRVANEFIAFNHVFGPLVAESGFANGALRTHLSRDLLLLLLHLRDELFCVAERLKLYTALRDHDQLVCCVSNRILVGLPVCRNEEFLNLACHYTEDVMRAVAIIKLLPRCLRSPYVKYMTPLPSILDKATSILRPTIELRLQQHALHEKSRPEELTDTLSWLIDEGEDKARTVDVLTQTMMVINFAAVHSTSMTITHALYQLAVMPECIEPLQEEITRVIKADGYTKTAFSKMRLLDSFIKESIRFHGIGMITTLREVVEDFCFSDGTFLPTGTHLAANAFSIHHDDRYYKNADQFIPFRFVDEKGEIRSSAASTSAEFLAFGYGKQSCPGRFLAVAEVKAVMAYIIFNYDLKLDGDGGHFPKSMHILTAIVPNTRAKLAFRKKPESERLKS